MVTFGVEIMSITRTHTFSSHANRSHSERNYLRRVFSVTVFVLVVGIYVSPIPMWIKWDLDCGSIPAWKCRWTCKDFQELKDLGADYHRNDPDFARVMEIGGLCQP